MSQKFLGGELELKMLTCSSMSVLINCLQTRSLFHIQFYYFSRTRFNYQPLTFLSTNLSYFSVLFFLSPSTLSITFQGSWSTLLRFFHCIPFFKSRRSESHVTNPPLFGFLCNRRLTFRSSKFDCFHTVHKVSNLLFWIHVPTLDNPSPDPGNSVENNRAKKVTHSTAELWIIYIL